MALLGFVLFCGGILLLCQNAYSTLDSSSSTFCYDDEDPICGPDVWPGKCQTGIRQSPIDIPLTSLHLASATKKHFFVSQSYLELHNFTLKNTGHNARLEIGSDDKSKMTLSGALVNYNNYTFAHVDFHWGLSDDGGSEHSLNGRRYAMEAHLVHYRSDFDNLTQALASQERHALTILAVFFHISGRENLFMANVTSSLEEIKEAGQSARISQFVLAYVLWYQKNPAVLQYDGSLTTPDCNESVLWNILSRFEPISLSQLQHFWNMNDNKGGNHRRNNRPLQRVNSRKIRYFHPVVRDYFQ